MEAASGFEPLNRSFADSSLSPLGYAAVNYLSCYPAILRPFTGRLRTVAGLIRPADAGLIKKRALKIFFNYTSLKSI